MIIELDTEPDNPVSDQLRSFRVGHVELLTQAQPEDSLRLNTLFESDESTNGEAIIHKACELFAIPITQVERKDMFDHGYVLTKTIGFKRPIDISIPKEQPNGE